MLILSIDISLLLRYSFSSIPVLNSYVNFYNFVATKKAIKHYAEDAGTSKRTFDIAQK